MEIKILGLGHVKSSLTEETIRQILLEESLRGCFEGLNTHRNRRLSAKLVHMSNDFGRD
jgi:hypothetical protein